VAWRQRKIERIKTMIPLPRKKKDGKKRLADFSVKGWVVRID
jgi:hypothetical protein